MKNTYLILAILGFIAPNILVAMESFESGNILLYAHPMDTIKSMFANRISSIFAIDLLLAVITFFIWSYDQNKKHKIKGLPWIWFSTLLFGLAGALPLFLFMKEKTSKI